MFCHFADLDEICTNVKKPNYLTAVNKSYIAIQINQEPNCFKSSEIVGIEIRGKTLKETITFYDDNTYSEFGLIQIQEKEKSPQNVVMILIFRH